MAQNHRGGCRAGWQEQAASIDDAIGFEEACGAIAKPAIIGWECERDTGIRDTLLRQKADIGNSQSIAIVIGSEGGLTDDEVAHAIGCGIAPVSMGKRIFRAETAGIIAAAAVLYEMDELG